MDPGFTLTYDLGFVRCRTARLATWGFRMFRDDTPNLRQEGTLP